MGSAATCTNEMNVRMRRPALDWITNQVLDSCTSTDHAPSFCNAKVKLMQCLVILLLGELSYPVLRVFWPSPWPSPGLINLII